MVNETLAQRPDAQRMGAKRMEVKTLVLTVEREPVIKRSHANSL